MRYFKSFLLISVALIITESIHSQNSSNTEITWSESMTLGFKSAGIQLIGEIDGDFYLAQSAGYGSGFDLTPEVELLKLDSDLKLLKEGTVKLEGNEGDRQLSGLYINDKQLYLLSTDRHDGKHKLFIETIDFNTLNSNNDSRLLVETNDGTGFGIGAISPSFVVRTSSDSTYTMIAYDMQEEDEEFKFWVFDEEWNELWSANRIGRKDLYVKSFDITKSGNVFLLTDKFESGGLFGDESHDYNLVGYFGTEKDKKTFRINSKYALNEPAVMELENDHVAIVGFYNHTEKENEMGSFFITIDEKGRQISTREFTSFGPEFLAFGNGEFDTKKIKRKFKKGKDVGLGDIEVRDLIRRDDGGLLLIGEEYSWSSGSNTRTYYFDDVYLINYDPGGSIRWQHKVPKQQRTKGGLYTSMSIVTITKGSDVYLLFNDNEDNANYKGPDNPKVTMGSVVMLMVKISGDGIKTRSIADRLNFKQKFLSLNSREYGSDDEVFLIAQSMRAFRFGKLEFIEN